MKPLKVYLAGGMKGDWQDVVRERMETWGLGHRVRFLDPRSHGLQDEDMYTVWDLRAVGNCDVLFAFLEADNPSGYGMTHEIGFAAAKDKYIIFADERSLRDPRFSRLMGMNRAVSDYTTNYFSQAVGHLAWVIEHPEALRKPNPVRDALRV